VYFTATKLQNSLCCRYHHVLTSALPVNKLSGVVVVVVLLKALHNAHVWHDLPMKYFVLFRERIKTTSCKILQASLNSPCRNSPIPRHQRCAIIVVRSQDPNKIFVYILKCVCAWHVITSLVFCCSISATCISLR